MTEYDCIVYGNNIYGLTVALFLARKMRKVLVVQDSSKIEDYHETMDIVDPENREYHFEYNPLNPCNILAGFDWLGADHIKPVIACRRLVMDANGLNFEIRPRAAGLAWLTNRPIGILVAGHDQNLSSLVIYGRASWP